MSATLTGAKLISVICRQGSSGWFFAESADLKGLLATAPSLAELHEAIPKAISDLYRAYEIEMLVTRVEERDDHRHEWVAFPAEIASRRLDELAEVR